MNIIERYIIKKIMILFFSILLACVLITWSIEILGKINIVTINGQNILTFLYMSLLFIPSVLTIVAPFAIAITTAQILHNLNQDSELLIIANASKGMIYIWRPIVSIAIVISLLLFFAANFLSPIARKNIRELMAQANANFLSNIIQEDTFFEVSKKLYLKIGEKDSSTMINNIFIADERDKNLISYYYAKNANILKYQTSYFLIMNNGVITQHNIKTNENSLISFNSYNFNLSNFMPSNNKMKLFPKDMPLNKLINTDNSMYKAELHFRLTSWTYALLFVIFALYFGGSPTTHREAKTSLPIILTIFSCLFFYILSIVIKNKAQTNDSYLILFYLAPILSLLTIKYLNEKLRYVFKK